MELIAEGRTFFLAWEVGLMQWLQSHVPAAGLSAISAISMFGEELVLIVILGLIYWGWDKRFGKRLGLAVLMGLVWNTMIKNVVLRRRPYFDHEEIKILRPVEPEADIYDISAQGYSFPSGHSTNAAGVYGGIAAGARRRWVTVCALVLILLVGFSRVVVGAHYPTDVIGGWALGAAVVLLTGWLQERIRSTVILYAVLLATAAPGIFYCRSADYFTGLGLLIGFMGGALLEERFVRFENTKSPLRMILRLAGGIAIYMVLNKVLKLPFSEAFLAGGTLPALLVRCARYMIIAFVDFGVYPLAFRGTDAGKAQKG